jgi:DNA-directed RNA polymerase subunit RPC12/RpoP
MSETMTYRCIYCSQQAVRITRTNDGCQVQCAGCAHIWRSNEVEISNELALRNYAMRGTFEH